MCSIKSQAKPNNSKKTSLLTVMVSNLLVKSLSDCQEPNRIKSNCNNLANLNRMSTLISKIKDAS